MLSYRHAFHAGNHADVLKHCVLLASLRHLGNKEAPFVYIDTHAGAGAYQLDSGYAVQNREWSGGWQQLAGKAQQESLPQLLAGYLAAIGAWQDRTGQPYAYPGSPMLAEAILRPQDRAVCCELHPTDFEAISRLAENKGRLHVRREDGFAALKSLLPPPERRGLILIDPSYELVSDYRALDLSLSAALKRFATGMYLVWYPLLERAEAKSLPAVLQGRAGLADRAWLNAGIRLYQPEKNQRGMYGSGMFVINPPFTLAAELRTALPVLASVLGSATADWFVDQAAET